MTHSMVRPQVDHCLTFLHRWQYLTLKTKTGQNPLFFPTWAYNRNRRRVTVGPRFSSTSPACTAVSISAYEDVTKAHPGITNGLLFTNPESQEWCYGISCGTPTLTVMKPILISWINLTLFCSIIDAKINISNAYEWDLLAGSCSNKSKTG